MLKTRVITALLLFAGFVVIFLVLTPTQFAVALSAILILGAWEWGRLCLPGHNVLVALYSVVPLGIVLLIRELGDVTHQLAASTVLLWCLTPLLMKWWSGRGSVPRLGLVVGVLVLSAAFVSLDALRGSAQGTGLFLWVMLALVWAADIGAYFVGRSLGRHKLAPRVSPGKTWEGFFGGMASAVGVGIAVLYLFPGSIAMPAAWWLGACLVTAMFSVLGDLTESLFKRLAGVKDSGSLLPGHGGILDRIDGVLAAAPVFAVAVYFLEPSGAISF